MLIPNCAVVKRTETGCGGKLKTPVVRQKLFKLEQKGERFFQADRKTGQMDYQYLSSYWRVNVTVPSVTCNNRDYNNKTKIGNVWRNGGNTTPQSA